MAAPFQPLGLVPLWSRGQHLPERARGGGDRHGPSRAIHSTALRNLFYRRRAQHNFRHRVPALPLHSRRPCGTLGRCNRIRRFKEDMQSLPRPQRALEIRRKAGWKPALPCLPRLKRRLRCECRNSSARAEPALSAAKGCPCHSGRDARATSESSHFRTLPSQERTTTARPLLYR